MRKIAISGTSIVYPIWKTKELKVDHELEFWQLKIQNDWLTSKQTSNES